MRIRATSDFPYSLNGYEILHAQSGDVLDLPERTACNLVAGGLANVLIEGSKSIATSEENKALGGAEENKAEAGRDQLGVPAKGKGRATNPPNQGSAGRK